MTQQLLKMFIVYEKSHPLSFLSNSYTWRKNKINQTVIEGEIVNRASLAHYANIGLKITYVTSQGKKREIKLALLSMGVLEPGGKNKYRHTLFDLFSKKSKVNVLIDQAEVKK